MKKQAILVVLVVLAMANIAPATILTYQLLPGSTITPIYYGQPIGPAEVLTGTFQWECINPESNGLLGFEATSLYFESDSYTISLNSTPLNNLYTSVFQNPPETYFGEIVDVTGLPMSTGEISSVELGSYTGLAISPTTLSYANIDVIESINGGMSRAKVILIAEQVPEPTTLEISVDIKPGSCPNPLRVNFIGSGVFPVALVGSADFDVLDINVDTVTLIGVPALRGKVSDVSTAGGVCTLGPDGIADLVLKFERQAVLDALEDLYGDITEIQNREELFLTLLAETYDGEPVTGTDSLVVLNRGAIKRKKGRGVDNRPPEPDPAQIAVAYRTFDSPFYIDVVHAVIAVDAEGNGVWYQFEVDGVPQPSWQLSDRLMNPVNLTDTHTYRVRYRDNFVANVTVWSLTVTVNPPGGP